MFNRGDYLEYKVNNKPHTIKVIDITATCYHLEVKTHRLSFPGIAVWSFQVAHEQLKKTVKQEVIDMFELRENAS